MNEHRRQILEMLAANKITADEAERLLAALEDGKTGASPEASESQPKPKPKYFRVLVEAQEGKDGEKPTTVNVRVPMQLLRAGVKLASFMPPSAWERVNRQMREQGMPVDLNQIKPENLEQLVDQLNDFTVDVDHADADANVKVRVFCE